MPFLLINFQGGSTVQGCQTEIAHLFQHLLSNITNQFFIFHEKDGYKAVSYSKLTAVLVEAVKELKARDERKQERIRVQNQRFERQQTEIEALRSLINELKG